MVAIPLLFVLLLIWLPALASVLLGFTRWEGIGGLDTIEWIGLTNYKNIFTIYPPFWPALQHNLIWLVFLFLLPTPFGMFLAVLLDKQMRGSRFYQTAIYLPVVLSLALTGFIWQLIYSTDQGLLNAVTGLRIDWYGDPRTTCGPCSSPPAGSTPATSCCSIWPASKASTRRCARRRPLTGPASGGRSSRWSSRCSVRST